MSIDIAWLAQGKLRIKRSGQVPATIESRFASGIRQRAVTAQQRHSWKFGGGDEKHGFAGRTVTLEVREQQRGLVKTWSQYIAAPHVRTHSGIVYRNIDGYQSAERREYKTQVEQDCVVEWPQPPPGNYIVRVVSNEGIVQQASFSVSN